MKRAARWVALIFGAAILLYCGAVFVDFYRIVERFGGIPYSWDLLRINARWTILAALGLILVGVAFWQFISARRAAPSD